MCYLLISLFPPKATNLGLWQPKEKTLEGCCGGSISELCKYVHLRPPLVWWGTDSSGAGDRVLYFVCLVVISASILYEIVEWFVGLHWGELESLFRLSWFSKYHWESFCFFIYVGVCSVYPNRVLERFSAFREKVTRAKWGNIGLLLDLSPHGLGWGSSITKIIFCTYWNLYWVIVSVWVWVSSD